jgi:uncharacterized protein (DUF58 family)
LQWPETAVNTNGHNIYADLKQLIRLQYKARGFSFLPRQPVHSLLSGRHSSRLRGRGLNFEELRHYRPGDDIRNMDWKVTRRLGKPHVRVYSEERERSILLVVDQRSSMFFGSSRAMKSVAIAELAALAGLRGLASGDKVGALIFSDNDISEIRPQRSRRQIVRILHQVTDFNHRLKVGDKPNLAQLNTVLSKVHSLCGHDTLICLLTDLSGADEKTDQLISRLAQHNDVLVGLVYDALENHLPKGGKLVVTDGELQLEVDAGDHKLRQRYEAEFDQRLTSARNFLQRRGVPILPINTDEDVAVQLRDLLSLAQHGGDVVNRLGQV